MKKKYTASAFVIDIKTRNLLLMYNEKLGGKWVQPGGKIKEDESPADAADREVYEETGINIKNLEKIDEKTYQTPMGEMKDIQYFAEPINYVIDSKEGKPAKWCSIAMMDELNVEEDIKDTYKKLLKRR